MKYRDPKAVIFENCSFIDCTLDGEPMPDHFLEWACSCGHRSKAEHESSPVRGHWAESLKRHWRQLFHAYLDDVSADR